MRCPYKEEKLKEDWKEYMSYPKSKLVELLIRAECCSLMDNNNY